ncbi:UTP--glucose-1-phosphate uridylyltransferase [Ensifer sp. HO-A22]|jgi:UTP--glucose-1-phosphate uridylyltransferase|uniref:UTP--glucose-1-phosphate uridylyltransferase n=1 Tax=Ensifer oleiphilus TaxID=2742698 RepID=A0A7Y6QBU0_9HYPH|nr:UTP--glucose-1-phosphate uridylyltransferase [Ensifer oleiphilus]NVD42681.1 UTP--glucose-1-phosphate uridylyltransferase [Ensifer oleiphilus]
MQNAKIPNRVRKAIIPAAGFGTRMLPATKSVPKELLPIVDRPILDYIVSEAFAAGIEHVIIVTGRMKGAIEDYFDHAFEVDATLRKAGKNPLADQLATATPDAGSISFVRQQQARGLGHAVWTARHIVGDEPFAVLLPDMLMVDHEPCLKSMTDLYQRHGGNVVAVERCLPEEAHKFGIVSLRQTMAGALVDGLVEKPAPGTAPSNLFISGRYILQPEIFSILENQTPGAGGEIQLTDAMISLMANQEIRAFEFAGRTFDCGNPTGFVAANLHMAMTRTDIAAGIYGEMHAIMSPARAIA